MNEHQVDIKRGCFYNLGIYFEAVTKKYEKHIALKYENQILSYQDLNLLSNKIASFLKKEGVIKQDVIGILNTKEPIGYATMLACLKIGAIYTNIDVENPKERLKKMFQTAMPRMIISDHKLSVEIEDLNQELQLPIFFLDEECLKQYDDQNLEIIPPITGANPAYIMFTSGSTGTPKGVLISHNSIINFIDWGNKRYNVQSNDIFAQVSPIYFDNSVFDFYTALFSGASLAPIKNETLQKPLDLVQLVDRLQCTILFSVPSLFLYLMTMKVLTKDVFKTIRILTFGGEGFPIGELEKLYKLYASTAQLINVYGPTEGTCICSSYELKESDFQNKTTLPPLGKINENFDFLIMDEDGIEVHTDNVGELCLLGPNVGLGYYNDPEQTQNAFVSNPLQKNYTEWMYKTGDLVRVDENNLLWFVGRKDNQIKHMGYRIELEEIENILNSIPAVIQSAVIYNRHRTSYGKIIAFVSSNKHIEEKDFKLLLQELLPTYMIPNMIKVVDRLPKNPNGKIDKVYLKKSLD